MTTIKYKSKNNKIWEHREKEWYHNGKRRPYTNFYETGGDTVKLIKYKAGKMKAINFLFDGDDVKEALCPTGYIYLITRIKGKKKIMRTKELTRITD